LLLLGCWDEQAHARARERAPPPHLSAAAAAVATVGGACGPRRLPGCLQALHTVTWGLWLLLTPAWARCVEVVVCESIVPLAHTGIQRFDVWDEGLPPGGFRNHVVEACADATHEEEQCVTAAALTF
jgi:hypothetical protein